MNLLSLLLCGACAPGTEPTDIPTNSPLRIGQILKFFIQRRASSGTTNTITISSANPNLAATWAALNTASDDTKVQYGPLVGDVTFEGGDAVEDGGGNSRAGGLTEVVAYNPITVTMKVYNASSALITALKAYECEDPLAIFPIGQCGHIFGWTDDLGTPTTFQGIPIENFSVSDRMVPGREGADYNEIRFQLERGWDEWLHAVTPSDFVAKNLTNA